MLVCSIATIIVSTAIAVLVAALLKHYRHSRLDLDQILSTPWPTYLSLLRSVKKSHAWIRECHTQCGPIFRFRVAHREVVMVADTRAAQQLLTPGPQYLPHKPSEYSAFDAAHSMGGHTGMLGHRDEHVWRAHRTTLAPAFTLSTLKPLQPGIMSALVRLAQRVSSWAERYGHDDSAGFSLNHEIIKTTVEIQLEVFMKISLADLQVDTSQVASDIEHLTYVSGGFIYNPIKRVIYSSPILSQLTAGGRAFHRARVRLASLTERCVDAVKASGPYSEFDFSFGACLTRLQDSQRPGQLASHGALAAEVANTLFASETVPSTIAFTLYLLATHPSIQQRVLSELQGAGVPVGSGPEDAAAALLQPFVMQQLNLLKAVISESMRLHPAGGPATIRVTDRAVRVGAYMVPAGTLVWPCIYGIMSSADNWDTPLQFNPDRWLSGCSPGTHPDTGAPRFVPFSIGPKSCAGQNLALLEVRWAVALLLACFDFQPAARMGSSKDVLDAIEMGFVYQPPGGLWFTAQPRRTSEEQHL